MCKDCNLSICYTVCCNNCTFTKDMEKNNLEINDEFEISYGYKIKILDIHNEYVTISIYNDSTTIIRNYMTNVNIPICINDKCFSICLKMSLTHTTNV